MTSKPGVQELATADDLYGDLDIEPAADEPAAREPSEELLKELQTLRQENERLKNEARVWAAQRAVLVTNLGAVFKTAQAQEQRRVREIQELSNRLRDRS